MQTVKVKTADLWAKLNDNRAKHEKEYREAIVDFRKACRKALEAATRKVKPEDAGIDVQKPVNGLSVSIQAPLCYLKEYDRAIMMMSMTTEPTVEITETDFRQYVMDEWNWKMAFSAANSYYKSAACLSAADEFNEEAGAEEIG